MEMHSERRDLDMLLNEMKNKKNILVSGASGIVGYGILKSLKESGYRLIGTTIYEDSPAECFSDIVEQAPLTIDESYIPWLVDTIKKYDVKMIIPAIEADMSCWNKNRKCLEETGTIVLLNQSELIELCLDKWKFYEKLRMYKPQYAIDTSLTIDDDQQFPILLKPRCGFGSKGIVKISSKDECELFRKEIGTKLMVQPIIGSDNEEYTVSAFFDNNSQLCASIGMKRKLSKQGFTEIATVIEDRSMNNIIEELAEIFQPVGPTNFQFRKHQEEWKLLEINPRISSSTSIRTAFGYNESQMCIDYFLKHKKVMQPVIKTGKAIRYTEDFIIYDSDNL